MSESPEIICLIGSSRFADINAVKMWEFAKQGKLALGMYLLPDWYWEQTGKTEKGHGAEQEGVADTLDELHLKKIDMADRVHVLNIGGYIGERTAFEIEYAKKHDKPITYEEPEHIIESETKQPSVKPTEKQRELITIVSCIIKSWESTNDFSSPTLCNDIKEEITKVEYLSDRDKQKLYDEIRHILGTIKYRIIQ